MHEVDLLSSTSSDDDSEGKGAQRSSVAVLFASTCILVSLAGAIWAIAKIAGDGGSQDIETRELGSLSQAPQCTSGNAGEWHALDNRDPAVSIVMKRGLHLVDIHRLRCKPRAPMLTGSICTSWLNDDYARASTAVRAQWKNKADCSGLDFKIAWPCGQQEQQMSLSYSRGSARYELLATAPDHCEMTSEEQGSFVEINITKNVEALGQQAVNSLQELMNKEGCAGSTPLSLQKVVAAASKATVYQSTGLILAVDVPDKGTVHTCMTARNDAYYSLGQLPRFGTGFFGHARFSACGNLQEWSSCLQHHPNAKKIEQKSLSNISEHALQGLYSFGLQVEDVHSDAIERQLLMDDWISGRALQAVPHMKPPMQHRHLRSNGTDLPDDHQPHASGPLQHCFSGAPILDQGSCGLCYAAASVTMLSIRKCINTSQPGHVPDPSEYNYATQEFGQCACRQEARAKDRYNISANCAARSHCDGGNIRGVWDRWMRMLGASRLKRKDCYAYTHRCMESSGIVNPVMNSGMCFIHSQQPIWDKPCDCIDSSLRQKPWQSCPSTQDACSSLDPPDNMYFISSRPQGLSSQETMENMQLHILEAGPLYATVNIPKSFWVFFRFGGPGLRGDVYTDASTDSTGGHAIVVVGWGKTMPWDLKGISRSGETYWTFRNSWGDQWGQNGYGNVLAGQDIMKIETSMAAGMFGPHADFAAPSCKWSYMTELPISVPGMGLARYSLGLAIECSEDATLEILLEKVQSSSAGQAEWYRGGPFRCDRGQDDQICKLDNIDLMAPGYGVTGSPTTANLIIRSWDSDGNEAWIPYGIDLGSAQSPKVWELGAKLVGVPGPSCSGCKNEGPFPDPGNAIQQLQKIDSQAGRGEGAPLLVEAASCSFAGSADLGALLKCNLIAYVIAVWSMLILVPCCCLLCCQPSNGRGTPQQKPGLLPAESHA